MEECILCSPTLSPLIAESDYWRLILNRNQSLLGKCFLVLNRHLEAVPQITPTEWAELHQHIRRTTQALTSAFSPDHFNYAFLQNQDRHVHLHIIPRYAEQRIFADMTFVDPDYPAHYSVPSAPRYLNDEQLDQLATHLRRLLLDAAGRH